MLTAIPLAFGLSSVHLLGLMTLLCILVFAIGVPIYLVFGLWVIGFHLIIPVFNMSNLAIITFEELQSFPYAAIPLFVLTGDLIYEMGVAGKIIDFAESVVGWMPGSAGNTVIAASGVFSAITGSNAATTASVGKAMFPELERQGYDSRFAGATIASGGTLGGMIPPSILMIIYGVTFGVSISSLFLAGVIPGLLMLVGLIVVNTVYSSQNGYGSEEQYSSSVGKVLRTAWGARIGLGTIIVLFGGIYSGVFTPSEAAVIAVAYILVMGILERRATVELVLQASLTSVTLIGVIIPIIVMSTAIQQELAFLGLQRIVSGFIIGLNNHWLMILAMVIIMLISGSMLASVPNLVLTASLLAPAATALGLSPITWGIIFLMSDMIGFITPPYGLNLYVISGITGIDYVEVARAGLPYLGVLIVVWLLLFLVPGVNFLMPAA